MYTWKSNTITTPYVVNCLERFEGCIGPLDSLFKYSGEVLKLNKSSDAH